MSDDTTTYGANDPAGTTGESAERVGFCQNCGKSLTKETARPVGGGVFCEPCLAARINMPPSSTAPGAGAGASAGAPYNAEPFSGSLPHPTLAALLGLIPGVGAVYNGQYAKGLAHFVILMVLSSMGNHVNGMFHVIALIWWIYQVVDAYQTAKARLEGRPLPNPFGLNEIGERLGFNKYPQAAASANVPPAAPPPTSSWQNAPVTPPPADTAYSPVAPGVPMPQGPGWVGYVPPEHFTAPPIVPPPAAPQATGAWGQAPYTQAFTGHTQTYPEPHQVPVVPVAPPQSRRFPVGAIWLIALGALFLLAEFTRDWGWHVNPNWVLAILFSGLAAWTFARRAQTGAPIVNSLRWPVTLAVLAVLFILQAVDVASLGRTWPVLFIAMGAMLILERAAHANTPYVPPVYPPINVTPNVDAEAQAERMRATWGEAPAQRGADDSTKGGL